MVQWRAPVQLSATMTMRLWLLWLGTLAAWLLAGFWLCLLAVRCYGRMA
jgi:hypothetical protein